jgi:colanic acid biosynthesis protein WcaH
MTDQYDPYQEMDVRDEYISEDVFAEFVDKMPQVCVEIILESEDGILIAKRNGDPPIWFWPGSRLFKGESLTEAAHRIAEEELGIEVEITDQYGPYEHFWEDSPIAGSPSRHTVNIVFHTIPANKSFSVNIDDQHSDYRFISEIEPDLHEYVRLYIEENNLL